MKNILTIFLLIILYTTNISSQNLPPVINFQGVLKDNAGTFYPDGNYQILINIYPSQFAVSSLWNETQTISVEGGIFSVQIGNAEPLNLEFDDAYWVGFSIDGGSELAPRLPLASVPYSFMSMNVMDESITAQKIADGEVVKSLNGLKDNVNLVAGSNVTITPTGNDITISASGGGGGGTIGGSGTANYLPLFSDNTTLGNSRFYQTNNRIGLGTTAPSAVFHLHDVSGLSHFRITSAVTGTTDSDGFTLSNAGTNQMFFSQHENANINFSISGTPTLIMAPGGLNGIGTLNPTTRLHVNSTSSPAFRLSDGTNANGNVLASDADGNASWQDKSSRYTQSGALNTTSVNLTSNYSSIDNFVTFTKVRDDSKIEVYLNSTARSGVLSTSTAAVLFQIRVNENTAQFGNTAAIRGSENEDFISIMTVFANLPAGTYTVSVWGRTTTGTSSGTLLDIGGLGGRIIVKETY